MKVNDEKFDVLSWKACYRCGFVDVGREFSDPDIVNTCPDCNERAVISFDWALNYINDKKQRDN